MQRTSRPTERHRVCSKRGCSPTYRAHQGRVDEYRERLQTLKDLFTDAKGFEKELAGIKKKLRHEEAASIAKQTGLSLAAAAAILRAKETPAEIAKLGLASFQASWGQIATGAKRIPEQQLAKLTKMEIELRQIREQGKPGMQNAGSRRF